MFTFKFYIHISIWFELQMIVSIPWSIDQSTDQPSPPNGPMNPPTNKPNSRQTGLGLGIVNGYWDLSRPRLEGAWWFSCFV